MVVFTCNYCGESLHKPKVEKHYQFTCRAGKSMTCVDCLKDFKEDYVGHTKCITEEERYAAKGTYKNGIVKKGESKQESWVEMIGNIVNQDKSLTPNQKNIFDILSQYSNVPRKKQKFINFMISSSGRRINQKDIEDVWNIIEKYKVTNAPSKNGVVKKPDETSTNGVEEQNLKRPLDNGQPDTVKPKKSKKSDFENIAVEETEQNSEKYSFKNVILEILSKNETISLKKLHKKVKKDYLKAFSEIQDEEKFIKKVNKKMKKIPNVKIENDTVTLVS